MQATSFGLFSGQSGWDKGPKIKFIRKKWCNMFQTKEHGKCHSKIGHVAYQLMVIKLENNINTNFNLLALKSR